MLLYPSGIACGIAMSVSKYLSYYGVRLEGVSYCGGRLALRVVLRWPSSTACRTGEAVWICVWYCGGLMFELVVIQVLVFVSVLLAPCCLIVGDILHRALVVHNQRLQKKTTCNTWRVNRVDND